MLPERADGVLTEANNVNASYILDFMSLFYCKVKQ